MLLKLFIFLLGGKSAFLNFYFYIEQLYNMENFGFTIQIPPFLKVRFGENKYKYAGLTEDQQKEYITKNINLLCEDYDAKRLIDRDIFFEKHQDGRIHAHGTFKLIHTSEILAMQNSFCISMGIKKLKQQNEVFNWIPLYDAEGWQKYITKDQENSGQNSADNSAEQIYKFKGKNPHLTVEF